MQSSKLFEKASNQKVLIRQFSAGGVVYKRVKEQESKRLEILWLLVQPARNGEFHQEIRWQLPKGLVDEGEKMEEAAVREVEEEGGVKAKVIQKIDPIKIFFRNTFEGKPEEKVLKTITFYLMECLVETEKGSDGETAEVIWLPFTEAKEKLTFKSEKEILEKAQKILESSSSQSALF